MDCWVIFVEKKAYAYTRQVMLHKLLGKTNDENGSLRGKTKVALRDLIQKIILDIIER